MRKNMSHFCVFSFGSTGASAAVVNRNRILKSSHHAFQIDAVKALLHAFCDILTRAVGVQSTAFSGESFERDFVGVRAEHSGFLHERHPFVEIDPVPVDV